MTHIPIKNKTKLPLMSLLKRRKTSLKDFLHERGITTYTALENYCEVNGVESPDESVFLALGIPVATVQTEGIVVLEPTNLSSEADEQVEEIFETETTKSKKRKKKQ